MKKLVLLLLLSLANSQRMEAVVSKDKVAVVAAYALHRWASNPQRLEEAIREDSYRKVRILKALGAN